MRNSTSLLTTLSALFIALPLLAGCGGGGSSPEDVAKAFVNADSERDIQPLVTPLAWEKMQADTEDRRMDFDPDKVNGAKIGASTINGETAKVAMVSDDGKGNFLMRSEGGKWKIYGMEIETDFGALTIDFEHPEALMDGMQEALGGMLDEAVTGMGEEMQRSMQKQFENMGKDLQQSSQE